MLIKTVSARSAAEALARVREQLGPDACVLETRRHPCGVEIVAAAERPGVRVPVPSPPPGDGTDGAARLRDDLVAWGFSLPVAERIAAAAETNLDAEQLADRVTALSYARQFVALWIPATPPAPGRMLAMVGPPGVGKTTTLAKLAAFELRRGERRVVLATSDVRRLGGAEQLEAYARILGVRFAVARDRQGLERVRAAAGERTLILLDTPGVPRTSPAAMDQLAEILSGVGREEIELLLAADREAEALADSVKRFARLGPGALGATRIDEAMRPGGLVTALARSGLPLRHLGTGPDVPDDLAVADPRWLAAWAVPR